MLGDTYLRARDYDAKTGVFTTVDPLDDVAATPTSGNKYAYSYNDPINQQDPSGMRADDDDPYWGFVPKGGPGAGLATRIAAGLATRIAAGLATRIAAGLATAGEAVIAFATSSVFLSGMSVLGAAIATAAAGYGLYRFSGSRMARAIAVSGSTPYDSSCATPSSGGQSVPPDTLSSLGECNERHPQPSEGGSGIKPPPTTGTSTCGATNSRPDPSRVGVDANALIRAIENGEMAALDVAIGGRTPVISPQAESEFLEKGSRAELEEWMRERGAVRGREPLAECVDEVARANERLGRTSPRYGKDIRVLASAIEDGVGVISRDGGLARLAGALGWIVEGF
jgi:RHS repeat-associated protein